MSPIVILLTALVMAMNFISAFLWLRQLDRPSRRGWRIALAMSLALLFTGMAFLSTRMIVDQPWIYAASTVTVFLWGMFLFFGFTIYLFVFEVFSVCLEGLAHIISATWAGRIRRVSLLAVPLAALIVLALGKYATTLLEERHVEIEMSKLERPLRVVMVSDIHVGFMMPNALIGSIVETIQATEPDLVLFAGDILNDNPAFEGQAADLLASIKSRYGSYGVFGNHEHYVGVEFSRDFFARAGIKLLRDEIITVAGLQIAGVDDPGRSPVRRLTEPGGIIPTLVAEVDPEKPAILLMHRPVTWKHPDVAGDIELTLSGHTHDGQLFPVHLIVFFSGQPLAGHYQQGENRHLVVSAGAGYWGVPLRVLGRPDITVIDLKPARAAIR